MTIAPDLLRGKKIALGVSGSISAYKSAEIVRLFIKAGAEVRVVMSDAAQKFITPLTLETLSRRTVLVEGGESWASDHNHIGLAHWADLLLIAPASAHTINKLANGLADNLLTQSALAFAGPKLLAPAANTQMLHNPITQGSLKMLNLSGFELIATQSKELACQSVGDGALAEPIQIFFAAARALLKEPFWEDRRVIVTGGGTVEKIDDVRYLSNFSSGKMASALATALYLRGADVNLIATRKEEVLPPIHTIDVTGTQEMFEYLEESVRIAKKGKLSKPSLMHQEQISLIQKRPFLFMAAAVSDYVPRYPQHGKLKKSDLGASWSLELEQNIDILSDLGKEGITTVAFKAEMDAANAHQNATALLDAKRVDAVCLNLLEGTKSFGTEIHQIDFITRSQTQILPKADKLTLALHLLDAAKRLEA